MRILKETPLYYYWEVIETQLRAWVYNPLALCEGFPNEPVYILCEILEANQETQRARIRPVDSVGAYWEEFKNIECVHEFAPSLNKVNKVFGQVCHV